MSICNSKKLFPLHTIKITKPFTLDTYIGRHQFNPCNASIIKNETGYILNIRCVVNNRSITINKYVFLDMNYKIVEEKMFETNFESMSSKKIIGIEDIRIFKSNNDVKFTGTMEINENMVGIVSGDYCFEESILKNINYIKPTFNFQSVEKNWVHFVLYDENHIIYKWRPLQICKIHESSLFLINQIETPLFFENFRGSSNGISYNDKYWFITHQKDSKFNNALYFHNFVIFNKHMKLIRYSESFRFEGNKIEFCMGIEKDNKDNFIILYSLSDKTCKMGIYSIQSIKQKLKWIDV